MAMPYSGERDRGTYLGLKNLDAERWEAGHRFAWAESLSGRDAWHYINKQIWMALNEKNGIAPSWWAGYGEGWCERDAQA